MSEEFLNALENGDLEEIKKLHKQKPRVMSETTFRGDNALHIAAREGHEQIVEWIHAIECLESVVATLKNYDDNTPLHEAARNGNAGLVQTLLQRNKSCASLRNKFGETPLIIACKYGHTEAVIKLLEAYNYMTETDEKGSTSTSTHQSASHTTYRGGETSLLYAAVQRGSVEIVRQILNHGTWQDDLMTKQDKSGRCAIHVAAMHGRWDIITELISKRRDSVEIRSSDHKSVLHFAVQYNQLEVVKKLLEGKNDFKRAAMVSGDHDDSHNTALHLAAKYLVDLELLDLLIFPGADLNARNDDGLTALDIACLAGKDNPDWRPIVRKLKRAGAMHTVPVPNTIPNDIVNAHMVVASLIATVTFAAIFQIPGGIEDDKNSIHYGAAKMAFNKVFRLFLFSDTAAFIMSLSVVVIWLIKRHWQETPLATLLSLELSDISEVNLLISIFWTVVAFVVATIIVVVPRDYDKLKNKDKEAFNKYQSLFNFEIIIAVFVPYLVVCLFRMTRTVGWVHRTTKLCGEPRNDRAFEWLLRTTGLSREPRNTCSLTRDFKWLLSTAEISRDSGIFQIFLSQFFMMAVLILGASVS